MLLQPGVVLSPPLNGEHAGDDNMSSCSSSEMGARQRSAVSTPERSESKKLVFNRQSPPSPTGVGETTGGQTAHPDLKTALRSLSLLDHSDGFADCKYGVDGENGAYGDVGFSGTPLPTLLDDVGAGEHSLYSPSVSAVAAIPDADPVPPIAWRPNLLDDPYNALELADAEHLGPAGLVQASSSSSSNDTAFNLAGFVTLSDDVLLSVSNATLVLLDGSDLERKAVLHQVPQLLLNCPDETMRLMAPEIGFYAVGWREDVQLAAAEALYCIVQEPLSHELANRIVVAALRIVQDSDLGIVLSAWGEVLTLAVPSLAPEDVERLIVPAALRRVTLSLDESRLLAARVFGAMSDVMPSDDLERRVLPHVRRLCEDSNASVRATMAHSLASLGKKMPLSVCEEQLWPILSNLSEEKDLHVRATALRAIGRTAESHRSACISSPAFRQLLLPIFFRECTETMRQASGNLRNLGDDEYLVLEVFAEVYGYFLYSLYPLFSDRESWNVAINAMRRMAISNGPTLRHWCAFHLPAVAIVCASSRPEKMTGVVHALACDPDVEIRGSLAGGLHKTVGFLASGPLRDEMAAVVILLLSDKCPSIRKRLLGHLAEILKAFPLRPPGQGVVMTGGNPALNMRSDEEKNGSVLGQNGLPFQYLKRMLLALRATVRDPWRTQLLLAKQIEEIAPVLPESILSEVLAPLLFKLARESIALVRQECMVALMHVVRSIPDVRRRDHILKHLSDEWAKGKVHWTRLAYMDACQSALTVFPPPLFKQLFSRDLLALAHDPVVNVRLRLARMMPSIARACVPSDAFTRALDWLLKDSSSVEVSGEARMAEIAIMRLLREGNIGCPTMTLISEHGHRSSSVLGSPGSKYVEDADLAWPREKRDVSLVRQQSRWMRQKGPTRPIGFADASQPGLLGSIPRSPKAGSPTSPSPTSASPRFGEPSCQLGEETCGATPRSAFSPARPVLAMVSSLDSMRNGLSDKLTSASTKMSPGQQQEGAGLPGWSGTGADSTRRRAGNLPQGSLDMSDSSGGGLVGHSESCHGKLVISSVERQCSSSALLEDRDDPFLNLVSWHGGNHGPGHEAYSPPRSLVPPDGLLWLLSHRVPSAASQSGTHMAKYTTTGSFGGDDNDITSDMVEPPARAQRKPRKLRFSRLVTDATVGQFTGFGLY